MSYGFYIDSSRQNEAERMKRLMDLFLFVKNADIELTPGDGDDGSNVRKISEFLKHRQERLEKKEAGNVLTFPGRS